MGIFPMLNLWGNLQGPLVPPLDRNFGFSQFFLWFCGKIYHRAKFHLPRTSGSARTFCSTNTQTFTFIYYRLALRVRRGGFASPRCNAGHVPGPIFSECITFREAAGPILSECITFREVLKFSPC